MSVAMTTKQILVTAKGEINYDNNPAAGPNSPREVNFYTVFSHPDPKDDPTTPAGGGNGGQSALQFSVTGGQLRLTWDAGTLLSAASVNGPFTAVAGAASPYNVTPTGGAMFFVVRQ
jgi:hypothetical protein